MIEMSIDSIRVSLINNQRVILLKEKTGARHLPIWIGPAEADAIAVKLQGVGVPRPLTHDLLISMIEALGGKVETIVINDLKQDTFYARINLTLDDKRIEIDSRPSDAIALAVRANAPILVDESILNKAGLFLDERGDQSVTSEGESLEGSKEAPPVSKPISKEEIEHMSAYADFLKTLNLDDLDKRKS